MTRYPMTEVIARREYDLQTPSGQVKVVAILGKPAPMPDFQTDWYCPWVIEAPDRRLEHDAAGVDSLQALLLAVSALRSDLQQVGRRGKLTYLEGEDLGIALVGGAA